jgi:hypothetical protein
MEQGPIAPEFVIATALGKAMSITQTEAKTTMSL